MLSKFNLGDHVCVAKEAVEYAGCYCGKVGVIKRVSNYNSKYGVELKGLHNDLSENGLYWFYEKSLIPQEEMLELDSVEVDIKKAAEAQAKLDSMLDTASIYFKNNLGMRISIKRYFNEITKVIFNNPATIVFWSDGTKTVVKCADGETFDEEKGLAMAISKRVLGNKGNYYNEFKKWLPTVEKSETNIQNGLRFECNSCVYSKIPPNEELCKDCCYYNSKHKPKKGKK